MHAFRTHHLDRYLDSSTLADKGYVGLGLVTPAKRRFGVKTNVQVMTVNRVVNRLRLVVEPVIA